MLALVALCLSVPPQAPPIDPMLADHERRIAALEAKCSNCPCATPELRGKPHDAPAGLTLCQCVDGKGCTCGSACQCDPCKCKDGECLKSTPFKSTGKGYTSVEGTVVAADIDAARTKLMGKPVVMLQVNQDNGESYFYFFAFKDEAVLVNGFKQVDAGPKSLVTIAAGKRCKLYLDPKQSNAVEGVELVGDTKPTFNWMTQQAPPQPAPQVTYQQPQQTYVQPPRYYAPPPMMFGGFGGGRCGGGG